MTLQRSRGSRLWILALYVLIYHCVFHVMYTFSKIIIFKNLLVDRYMCIYTYIFNINVCR